MGCVCTSEKKPAKKQKPFKASMDAYIVKDKIGQRTETPAAPPAFQVKTTRFIDEYALKEQLSQSLFCEVRKVIHKQTGLTRAVKILKRTDVEGQNQQKMLSEIQTLMSLDHPNILKLYEVFETKQKYFIVSEYLEGGELFERIVRNDKFSEEDAAQVMKQILSGVAYCHHHNIIHGDLKPENLVYGSKKADAHLKIIDFDATKAFDEDQKAYHIAPEVLNRNYTQKCDIWSCGVILYVLLSGIPPFSGKDNKEILKKVKSGKYGFEDFAWVDVSEEAQNFIKKMMEIDIDKRYSAEEALNDPWFIAVQKAKTTVQPLSGHKLKNLGTFIVENKLYDISRTYLGAYFSSYQEKEKLLEEYIEHDVNDTGYLGAEQLKQGYFKMVGISNELSEEAVDSILQTLEQEDGKIDYKKFVETTNHEIHVIQKEKLDVAFKGLVAAGADKVLAAEIMLIFNGGKIEGMTDEQWDEWGKNVQVKVKDEMSLNEVQQVILSLTKLD